MKHVLAICVDHWPGYLFGHRGHPSIQTPTLDAIAQQGRVFTRAYSECPVCIPARRTMMTGTTPKCHGDRVYNDLLEMPDIPTMAECFRDAGYQTTAVGKLHVYPQRDRIGFDDVWLTEEGRTQFGVVDDYEHYLAEHGLAGQAWTHGMGNNSYITRPWHLPEEHHVTNWATREMCRHITRRDPKRSQFWYLQLCPPSPSVGTVAIIS